MLSRLRGISKVWLASIVLGSLILGLVISFLVCHGSMCSTLSHWTGEEDLGEQVKGTFALLYLRLTCPRPRTDPFVPIAHAGLCPYGVNTFLEQEAEVSKVDRSLQMIAQAGFRWIRQQFPWEDIEIAGKGDYWDHKWHRSAWTKYDDIVNLAEKHGIQIIARLDNPPAWTRSVGDAQGWSLAPPDNYEDFGDFVYAVVSRYRGRIHYYQIWNEPNIFPEWGDQPADPAAYVDLLKIAYRRAKEADPNCVILCAGLAQTTEEAPPEFGPRNMSDLVYLEKMYEAGVKDCFDIMGAMVYGLWTGPYDLRTSHDRSNFSRVQLTREIMVRHGDGDKPIWATEVGWNATPEDFAAYPNFGRVTEDQQAVYAVEAYERAANEWPWMGVMSYWFLRRPTDTERDQTFYYFRMVEPDFSPLPVYAALSVLANQPPAVPIGYHQQDHWALCYHGPWREIADQDAVLGSYALGNEGAELDFLFSGTSLELVLRGDGPARGPEIAVDGEVMALRATKAGSYPGTSIMTVAKGLANVRHTARIRIVADPLALDGLIVRRRRPVAIWAGAACLAMGLALAVVYVPYIRQRRKARHE